MKIVCEYWILILAINFNSVIVWILWLSNEFFFSQAESSYRPRKTQFPKFLARVFQSIEFSRKLLSHNWGKFNVESQERVLGSSFAYATTPKIFTKIYGPGKVKSCCFDHFLKFLTFLENYPPKSVFGFNRNYSQSYDSRKCQYFDLMTVVWTFLVNYPDKSDTVGLIETTDCWKPAIIIGYSQFSSEKYLGSSSNSKFWNFDRFL